MTDTRATDEVRAELYEARNAYLALSSADRHSKQGKELLDTITTNLGELTARGEAT